MEELSIWSLWNTLYRFVQRLLGQVFFFLMKDCRPWIEELTMKLPNTLVCQCASHTREEGGLLLDPFPTLSFCFCRFVIHWHRPLSADDAHEESQVAEESTPLSSSLIPNTSTSRCWRSLQRKQLYNWLYSCTGRATTVRSSPWIVLLRKESTTSARCQRPEQAWVCFSSLGRGKFSLQTSQCLTQRCLVMPTVPQAWSPSARMEMESTQWLQSFIFLAGAQHCSRLSTERRRLFSQRPQSGAATSLEWAEPGMSNDHHHEFMEKQRKWVIADSLSGSFFFFLRRVFTSVCWQHLCVTISALGSVLLCAVP